MHQPYPSDVSRKQFEKVRPFLEKARKRTKPCTLDLYEVFCAVLYVLKSGCQWRMLPSIFPDGRAAMRISASGARAATTTPACWSRP